VTQPPVKTTLPVTVTTTAKPLPKIPPANNWTSNLPNKSGAFESEFDDFSPKEFSSEDPIYLETQRKMAAIKMKERSLAGSTGIELARALVVDESWNQLNKLTQLMEMIMYLQGESQITKEYFVCKTIAQKDLCETRQSQNKTIAICGKRLFYAIVSLRNCLSVPFFI
jgi:hypothetical protein